MTRLGLTSSPASSNVRRRPLGPTTRTGTFAASACTKSCSVPLPMVLSWRGTQTTAAVAKLLIGNAYGLEQLAGCLVIVEVDHVRIRHPSTTSEDAP